MLVFAVETSCDETSVCILNHDKKILSHIVFSQKEHIKFGGVVPELASRAHLQILQSISQEALNKSKIDIEDIDVFCATCGPGLIGGLLVGSIFAKSLALGSSKAFVPINHLEGHLLSPTFNNNIVFPCISFLLTGGHTQIYLINSVGNYELLGETLDDALGETFDKVAKLIGLSYPGGPEIEKKAKNGNVRTFNLPNPLEKKQDLNFSFSGMKTAINLIVKKHNYTNQKFQEDLSASFQEKVVSILESKLALTIKHLNNRKINISQICLVGGVASNKYICEKIKRIAHNHKCSVVLPLKDMLSDNAAMIAWACLQKYLKDPISNLHFKANSRLKILNDSK